MVVFAQSTHKIGFSHQKPMHTQLKAEERREAQHDMQGKGPRAYQCGIARKIDVGLAADGNMQQ